MGKRLTEGEIEKRHKQMLSEIELDFQWRKQMLYEGYRDDIEIAWLWREQELRKLQTPIIIKTKWGVLFG